MWVCQVTCNEDPQDPFIVLSVSERGARLAAIKTVQEYAEEGSITDAEVLADYSLETYELPVCDDNGDMPCDS